MPDVSYGSLPFSEQIAFFRRKLNLPTNAWTDIWQSEHDHAFVVAGANRDDLLADFRAAVDRAIVEGATLEQFRKEFDRIVEKYGWSYNGSRNWRSRVIYETNLRTSYAAGRYAQLQELKRVRPYWEYVHSDAVEHPRPLHLAWNGLVLDADDPWWEAHFPPGGWGCQCTVQGLNARDLKRKGKDGPDTAPPTVMETVTVGKRGPSPRTVQTPEGIDPGFGYTPGRSWIEKLSPTFEPMPSLARAAETVQSTLVGEMPAPRVVSANLLLPDDVTLDKAIGEFLDVFGAAPGNPVVFSDAAGDPLVISDALFKTRSGRAKADALLEARKRVMRLLAETISDPDEIWISWSDVNDASGAQIAQLRRRYLARFDFGDGTEPAIVVFEIGRYGWTGTTAFVAERDAYLLRQRVGERIFVRSIKGEGAT
jgi:hypothetical protein